MTRRMVHITELSPRKNTTSLKPPKKPIRANHVHDIGGADDERAPQGHCQVQVIVSKMPLDLFDVLPVPKYVGRKKERQKNARYSISFCHSAE